VLSSEAVIPVKAEVAIFSLRVNCFYSIESRCIGKEINIVR